LLGSTWVLLVGLVYFPDERLLLVRVVGVEIQHLLGDLYAPSNVGDAVKQFALRNVSVRDGLVSDATLALKLPSAVGSLQAERSFLPHRVAEERVQFDHSAIQVLDGDSGVHGFSLPD